MTTDGPIVDEVRERARQISERFGHDLKAYARHLREIAEQNRDRVVNQITVVASPRPSGPPPTEPR